MTHVPDIFSGVFALVWTERHKLLQPRQGRHKRFQYCNFSYICGAQCNRAGAPFSWFPGSHLSPVTVWPGSTTPPNPFPFPQGAQTRMGYPPCSCGCTMLFGNWSNVFVIITFFGVVFVNILPGGLRRCDRALAHTFGGLCGVLLKSRFALFYCFPGREVRQDCMQQHHHHHGKPQQATKAPPPLRQHTERDL